MALSGHKTEGMLNHYGDTLKMKKLLIWLAMLWRRSLSTRKKMKRQSTCWIRNLKSWTRKSLKKQEKWKWDYFEIRQKRLTIYGQMDLISPGKLSWLKLISSLMDIHVLWQVYNYGHLSNGRVKTLSAACLDRSYGSQKSGFGKGSSNHQKVW